MGENNFEFHGIPSNDEIEIPDVKNNAKAKSISTEDLKNLSKSLSSSDINDIKKHLPPEMLSFMEAMGTSPDKVINQALSMLEGLDDSAINKMMNEGMAMSFSFDSSGGCGGCDDCADDNLSIDEMFPTGNQKFLFPEEFGSIECQTSETLYDDFVAVYGTDSTKYLDDNVGLRNFLLNDITSKLNFDEIKNLRFINSNKKFILFYMEPKNETDYGFYAAVIKLPDNSFAVYIPTYCNTFDIVEDENEKYTDAILFNEDDQTYAFNGPASDITSFAFLGANMIEFAIDFALAPVKHTLLTPVEFGVIKPTRASVNKDSSMLPIGRIMSNKGTSSTLLLKDAELPLDSEYYNLFMKFPRVVDEHTLRFLSGILFNVDFNNCKLLENVELKYTSDGKLYFDVDFVDF